MIKWQTQIESKFEQMVEMRRYLHMHPELSFHEIETHKFILSHLRKLDKLDIIEPVGERGIVAKIEGKKPGKTIAFRADFDALPIQDEKDVPYKSTIDGAMHACGHDGHTTTLLTLCTLLNENYDAINGNVVFIFQYAEEVSPGGANPMIIDGALDGVDTVYGNHFWSGHETSSIKTNPSEMMASPDYFKITIQGKGGHGAKPHTSIDPIVIAAEYISSLQKIISRKLDPIDRGVLTVGKIEAGTAFNIISDTATLEGTVRTFKPEVKEIIEVELERLLKGICIANDATYDFYYRHGYPTVVNHNEQYEIVKQAAEELGLTYDDIDPMMIGEDFSYYLLERPGCFFLTGSGNESKGSTIPHHHPMFDLDEDAMKTTTAMFIKILEIEGVL
ncbi:amidohydrolase [Mammaliicoccus stepanovicii]|uniref:N-acyl-L-amino acid amidohydrolase n=1 Tax=Mammaliicoccus stepanovicii TaxID=643214 RepID=A0A240AA46_9STAP|nr:amidohydrolase [Mammaliicoccus stepanovicii]PNZ77144.1 amidohydrolase [Mammaliicoccus stepanovicii]GGI39715.1 N-acetyl-L,L-diaminopimelate deacetylase [Mammaliicoccus stepanovicii]SNV79756.1 N-acyl-L-amino acid amidohydrolase [Mammaliicoccus stepanovicii]